MYGLIETAANDIIGDTTILALREGEEIKQGLLLSRDFLFVFFLKKKARNKDISYFFTVHENNNHETWFQRAVQQFSYIFGSSIGNE